MLTKEQIQEFINLAESNPDKQNQEYIAEAIRLAPELAHQLLELMDIVQDKEYAIWYGLRMVDSQIEDFDLNYAEVWDIIERNIGIEKLSTLDLLTLDERKTEEMAFLDNLRQCLATGMDGR